MPEPTTLPDCQPVQVEIPRDGAWETECCDCGLEHRWQIIQKQGGGYVLTIWREERKDGKK